MKSNKKSFFQRWFTCFCMHSNSKETPCQISKQYQQLSEPISYISPVTTAQTASQLQLQPQDQVPPFAPQAKIILDIKRRRKTTSNIDQIQNCFVGSIQQNFPLNEWFWCKSYTSSLIKLTAQKFKMARKSVSGVQCGILSSSKNSVKLPQPIINHFVAKIQQKILAKNKGNVILDGFAQWGDFTTKLTKENFFVISVDMSSQHLDYIKQSLKLSNSGDEQIEFIQANFLSPFIQNYSAIVDMVIINPDFYTNLIKLTPDIELMLVCLAKQAISISKHFLFLLPSFLNVQEILGIFNQALQVANFSLEIEEILINNTLSIIAVYGEDIPLPIPNANLPNQSANIHNNNNQNLALILEPQ